MASATVDPAAPIRAAGLSDVGRMRDHNEDSILVRPDLSLYAVADGMGGHAAGDVASALAIETLVEISASPMASRDAAKRLHRAVREANRRVFERGGGASRKGGMGSTLVALSLEGARVHICHVGDSRCYRIRDGAIEQLTRDHNMINDALALNPDIDPEILAELPKNVITRALGMTKQVDSVLRSETVAAGDVFLLCSDGLSGTIEDPELCALVSGEPDLEAACKKLIDRANAAGGSDNISAVLVAIDAIDAIGATVPIVDEELPEPWQSEDPPTPVFGAQVSELGSSDDPDTAVRAASVPPAPPVVVELSDLPEPEPISVLRCPSCKSEIVTGTVFCVGCGQPHGFNA